MTSVAAREGLEHVLYDTILYYTTASHYNEGYRSWERNQASREIRVIKQKQVPLEAFDSFRSETTNSPLKF